MSEDGAPRHRLLIADDEESMRFFLRRALSRKGFETEVVESGGDAVQRWGGRRFDAALLDLKMPGMDGLEALRRIREQDPDAVVVLMTGHATISSAVEAMRLGAVDYVTKPLELDEVVLVLERALAQRATLNEVRELRHLADSRDRYGSLVGQSEAMRKVFETIDLLQGSDATVLIQGESGTGKELVARAVHLQSHRSGSPFVPLNCAALPDSLLENELFGHLEGAYTGAQSAKRGLLERAEGGTLFLDEVSEISLAAQAKIARFLQERQFTPLGGTEPHEIDLRVVAATNRQLAEEVEAGRFREELYWRLNVVPVHLVPLRERREDVPLLANHFLDRFRREGKTRLASIELDASILLANHPWPGNVRELQNTIERLAVMHADQTSLRGEDLPEEMREGQAAAPLAPRPTLGSQPFARALAGFEQQYFAALLERTKGNVSEAARQSEVSRPQLHRKIRQLGLDPERYREPR